MREFFDKFDVSINKVMLIAACILLSECHYKNLLGKNDSNGALLVVILNHFFNPSDGNLRMPEKDEPEVFARWINLRHGRSRYQAITNAPEVSEDDIELIGCHWKVWLWDELDSLWAPEQSLEAEVLPTTLNAASNSTNSPSPALHMALPGQDASHIPHLEDEWSDGTSDEDFEDYTLGRTTESGSIPNTLDVHSMSR